MDWDLHLRQEFQNIKGHKSGYVLLHHIPFFYMLSTAARIFLMCPIESESVSWSKSKSPHPVTGHQLVVLVLNLFSQKSKSF
jgi:hypothetical protein